MKLISRITILMMVALAYSSCKNKEEKETPPPAIEKKEAQPEKPLHVEKPTVAETDTAPTFKSTYHKLVINDSVTKSLKNLYPDSQLTLILALNRIDYTKLWRKKHIVVPDSFRADNDLMAYSPFPTQLPAVDSVRKLILFSYTIQAFGVYENGKLIRWGPTSMGKKSTPTPVGLFHTNWKGKQIVSTVNDEWVLNWYFNVINSMGVSMHQYEMPGYPASHSCMRLREQDAEWFYYWADQWKLSPDGKKILAYGTPVLIFGEYAYEKAAPWNKLLNSGDANNFTPDTLGQIIRPFLDTIMQRQAMRDSLSN